MNAKTRMLNMAPAKVPIQLAFFINIPRTKIPAMALPNNPITSWKKKNKDLTGNAAIKHAIMVPNVPTIIVTVLAIFKPFWSETDFEKRW